MPARLEDEPLDHLTLRVPRWVSAALVQVAELAGKKRRTIAREWLEDRAREVKAPAPERGAKRGRK